MSKLTNIPPKLEVRNLKRRPSQALLNPSPAPNPDRPDFPSESPYTKKLVKFRSVSNIKERLSHPALQPSPLKPNFQSSFQSTTNLNASLVPRSKILLENRSRSTKKLINLQQPTLETEISFLDLKLEDLAKQRASGISNEIFLRYQECFEEIIEKDSLFGPLLNKIKLAYKDWIGLKAAGQAEVSQLKSEIFEFSKKLTKEVEENKLLHRKMQKISKENVELGRELDEKEKNFRSLQDYLLQVTKISIETLPQDKVTWKVLVAENKSYADLCEKLKKKMKIWKKKESRFMKLFWNMKQKGYPVEEMFEKVVSKKNEQNVSGSATELSDNERISDEPAKSRLKPSSVPVLSMRKVEPNSFSEEQDSEESDIEFCFE